VPRILIATVLATALVACGGSPAPAGPTAASVAVQSSDLPSGMTKCDLTGDIDSFLTKEKTADASTYQSTKTEWDDAKSKGATAAYTAFYTDSSAHCDSIKAQGSSIGSAAYKLVVNFVIQFKDEASATKGYESEQVFNVSPSQLRASGQPIIEGANTGLSKNSIVLNSQIANQSYYIAVWQNKTFLVILAILNVDAGASKKAATSENGRIK
jgi:hypothetical protein